MKLLVAGYSQDETHRVSAELRSAGHQVLGALGRSGARTFVKVVTPDLIVVPAAEVDTVREWIADMHVDLTWLIVEPGADAVRAVAGRGGAGPVPARDESVSFEPPSPRRGTATFGRPQPVEPAFSYLDEGPAAGDGAADTPPEPPPLPSPRLPLRPELAAARIGDPVAPDAPAAPAAPPSDLVSKLAQTRFGDYHSLLEVEPGASPYAVREQFTRLSRLYSPRGWPRKLGPEELEILQEVASGIRDAFLILGDPELRARYERALIGGASAPPTRRS